MKRLRSSEEGLEMELELESESYGKRGGVSRDPDSARSNHRSNHYHHYKSSSARYDRTSTAAAAAVEERDNTYRPFRWRSDFKPSRDFDHRRKGFDSRYHHHNHQHRRRRHHHRQHRDFSPSASASASSSSPGDRGVGVGVRGVEKSGYARIHRSESFSGPPPRRSEFPKGFRSDRNQPWREGSVSSSWRRYGNVGPGGGRDFEFEGGGGKSSSDSISLSWGGGGGRTRSPFLEDRSTPIRSPRASFDAKTLPAPSRDSQIDRSKTTHVNKTEEVQVVENASTAATTAGCGEMEEGELEPEQQQQQRRVSGPESESAEALVQPPVAAAEETTTENLVKSLSEDGKELDKESGSQPKAGLLGAEPSKECSSQGKLEAQQQPEVAEKINEGGRAPNETLGSPKKIISGMKCHEDELITTVDAKVECCRNGICDVEVKENTTADGCLPSVEEEVEGKDCNDKDPVIEAEGTHIPQTTQMEVSGVKAILKLNPVTDEPSQSVTDKGKGLVLFPPHIDGSTGWEATGVDSGSNKLVTCRNSEIEDGSNTRGFDLFPSPMVKKPGRKGTSDVETLKDEMILLEPLDLTLSLPNVLLPISSCALNPAPASPNHAVSVQSLSNTLCTDSNGFTASMSFSGSQLIIHNPSCSLTHNSLDNYEHSVGSHPIFQGVDQACQSSWQGKSANDPKQKDIPPCQRISMNGNGSLPQYHASQGIINGKIVEGQHLRVSETSSKGAPTLDQQLSFSKQLSGVQGRHYSAVGSPCQSAGSYETGSEYNKDQKKQVKQKNCGIMYRSCSQKGNELVLRGGSDFVEAMISMIVCEPVHVTNRRFHEMTEQATACLRESISEFLANPSKQRQQSAIQKALQMRSDFNLDILLKCPQVLLEVLVALKTGLGGFLQQHKTSTSHLAEIFLDLRCRNLNCRRLLPVDECECKVCAQKTGFCSSCMCLVCSNFDLAFNTCSWVGCDICLHWCHTDCGLQKSLIRNGQNVTEGEGPSEMQFHCVACGQPSEMYGFVKEVFQKFAKIWPVETLSRELEYVRRIFWASKDMKGRQLHDIADKMLAKLINGSELPTVYNLILHFLSESGPSNSCTIVSEKELGEGSNGVDGRGKEAMQHDLVCLQKAPQLERTGKEQGEGSNGIDGWGKEAMCHDLIYSENEPQTQLDRTACIPPWFDSGRIEKCNGNSNLQHHVLKEPVFDELESIVRIKQAEAKMFQTRADDAKREAEELKRIATAKNEKLDEEFRNRIMKLRLIEAEEMRKQKLEQLQAFERAHQDYFNMKTRMEVDIKDLLLKMEATKQKLSL